MFHQNILAHNYLKNKQIFRPFSVSVIRRISICNTDIIPYIHCGIVMSFLLLCRKLYIRDFRVNPDEPVKVLRFPNTYNTTGRSIIS